MKKALILCMALAAFFMAQAQWANDPINNNFIANTSADAGEIYLSTNDETGDTYVQWNQFFSNGWSPTLQRLNYEGVPQWGNDGIHIGAHEFSSMSEGLSMTTTTDGAVVSCFAVYDGFTYAVKINADGTFAWGEQGVQLFNGQGFSRTEIIAGNDGGCWALGFDYTNLFLQYINANGSLNPTVTISDNGGQNCSYGQLTLGNNNNVFVTYEKCGSSLYTDKELFVAGYATDGTQISPETLLMSSQTFQITYSHTALSDGMGGGYAYIWHPGIGEAFNTYVFHFNANGASTIVDPNGVAVHSMDPQNNYLDAYASVDPSSHDLLIAYQQTDSDTQSQCKLYINRITPYGDKLWGDGKLILDNGTNPAGGLRIDAYEYQPGFSVIYHKGVGSGFQSIVEAKGFIINGDNTWNTVMCSSTYEKTGDQNSTGFHLGQNIVAWVNSNTGGLYGQNIGVNGTMGQMTPPTPPEPCYAPSNFMGKYLYDNGTYGVQFDWVAPETLPLHYVLYRKDLSTNEETKIDVDPLVITYFDAVAMGDYQYWFTAVHSECESEPASTPDGNSYILVEVTSVNENDAEDMITVTKIYTMNGQLLRDVNVEDLSKGVYIVQGLTSSGKLVSRKVMVN